MALWSRAWSSRQGCGLASVPLFCLAPVSPLFVFLSWFLAPLTLLNRYVPTSPTAHCCVPAGFGCLPKRKLLPVFRTGPCLHRTGFCGWPGAGASSRIASRRWPGTGRGASTGKPRAVCAPLQWPRTTIRSPPVGQRGGNTEWQQQQQQQHEPRPTHFRALPGWPCVAAPLGNCHAPSLLQEQPQTRIRPQSWGGLLHTKKKTRFLPFWPFGVSTPEQPLQLLNELWCRMRAKSKSSVDVFRHSALNASHFQGERSLSPVPPHCLMAKHV